MGKMGWENVEIEKGSKKNRFFSTKIRDKSVKK